MLAEASVALARQCAVLTSVARTRQSLEALDRRIRVTGCLHHMLALDWSDARTFVDSLDAHVRRAGAPSLTLAWLHDESLAPSIAAAATGGGEPSLFFHVRGSTAADPSAAPAGWSRTMAGAVGYHQIILGFRTRASGTSRWLTDAEISAGVLAAIDRPGDVTVVGTIEPWHLRP